MLPKLLRITDSNSFFNACSDVQNVPLPQKCQFVTENPNCRGRIINIHILLYCEDYSNVIIILTMIAMIVLLFFIIAVVAEDFMCPNVTALATALRLPDSIAGVTILALGNGSPDVMTVFSSMQYGRSQTMFNGLMGSALFDATIVIGMIYIVRPFEVEPMALIRDVGFLIITVMTLYLEFDTGRLNWLDAMVLLLIYAFYVLFVAAQWLRKIKESEIEVHKYGDELDRLAKEEFNPRSFSQSAMSLTVRDIAKFAEHAAIMKRQNKSDSWLSVRTIENDNSVHLSQLHKITVTIREIYLYMKPIDLGFWRMYSLPAKIFVLAKMPFLMVLKLVIPLVNFTIINNAWCKPMVMINCFLLPHFLITLVASSETTLICLPYTLCLGTFVVTIIFFTSNIYDPPKYHWVISVFGFVACFTLIWFLCQTVVGLLQAIAVKYNITRSLLPSTILAWGSSIGDFVTNVALARSGYPKMGAAACYAGPLFNIIIDIGFSVLYRTIITDNDEFVVSYGEIGPVLTLFLGLTLLFTLIFVPLLNFHARRSFGTFLCTSYLLFLFFCIADALKFIFPFGDLRPVE